MKAFLITVLLCLISISYSQHGAESMFFPSAGNQDVIFLDLTNVDHANGAEVPKNMTEEDTKIIPTNIDFSALKEVYAKENKAERFLPSRLSFEDEPEDKKKK